MNANRMGSGVVDPTARWLYRVGGLSALAIAIGYIVIIALYVSVGRPPEGGEAWLTYGAGKTDIWWGILALSVLTDILLVPLWLALYLALRGIHRDAMLLATALMGLFVVLELSVGWPAIGVLITLSGDYAAATTDAQRAVHMAAAEYASLVGESTLAGVYSIAIPGLATLVAGFVMLKGVFGRGAAYVGVLAGILGIASVVLGLFVSALGQIVILASILTLVWYVPVGYRLYRLGQVRPEAGPRSERSVLDLTPA